VSVPSGTGNLCDGCIEIIQAQSRTDRENNILSKMELIRGYLVRGNLYSAFKEAKDLFEKDGHLNPNIEMVFIGVQRRLIEANSTMLMS
jgi:hypothetical protein